MTLHRLAFTTSRVAPLAWGANAGPGGHIRPQTPLVLPHPRDDALGLRIVEAGGCGP